MRRVLAFALAPLVTWGVAAWAPASPTQPATPRDVAKVYAEVARTNVVTRAAIDAQPPYGAPITCE